MCQACLAGNRLRLDPSRRDVLRLGAGGIGFAAAVGPPRPASASTPALKQAYDTLRRMALDHAAVADNPWRLLHGIRAVGPHFSIGGEPAADYIARRYLEEAEGGGRTYLRLATGDEGHPDAFLAEGVLEPGLPPQHVFRRDGGRDCTVADLIAGAKASFRFDPATTNLDESAWTLLALALSISPGDDTWQDADGRTVRFTDVLAFAMAGVEQASGKLAAAMRDGTPGPLTDRIHDFACGGMHLVYALGIATKRGHGGSLDLSGRVRRQCDLAVWRLDNDPKLIARYYAEAAKQYPKEVVGIHYADARLKFLGHTFEVINYGRANGLFAPSPAQSEVIQRAENSLAELVEILRQVDIARFAGDRRLMDLLVGDICHACHALALRPA